MRRTLISTLALVTALALPAAARAADADDVAPGGQDVTSTESAPDGTDATAEPQPEDATDVDGEPEQSVIDAEDPALEEDPLWDPEPDEEGLVATQRHGFVAPEDLEPGSTTVVEDGVLSLPAPQPGAEVYNAPSNGVYQVTGGGFGHRIGMSQYGADGAGRQGLSHSQILSFYYPGTRLDTNSYGTIRIGITIDNDGVTRVDGRSGLQVSAGPSGATYTLPSNRDQWRVRATSSSASSCVLEGRVGGSWSSYWPSGMPRQCPVTFSNASENTVDLWLPGDTRRVYRGSITATHTGSSNLVTVNRLPMQHYLRSVVSVEMPPTFHQQALRAQAVAARTYAARGAGGNAHYDTCDTTWCQAYRGRGIRNGDGSITTLEYTNSIQAVDATSGQVLTYPFSNGRGLATTMYSSSTGGQTVPGGAGHGYLRAQADPYDNVTGNSRHRWSARLPVSALQSRYNIADVRRIQVLERDGYGEWGGAITEARVEGYTSSGTYTWARATGQGLQLARLFPNFSDGLSSDYFTFGGGSTPNPTVGRLGGDNRYETAERVSRRWSPGVSVVYVASGDTFADALTASARAGVFDAPVLLTQSDRVPNDTRAAMTRLRPGRVVVVGGTTAIDNSTAETLRGLTTSGGLQRVQGTDRYLTAAQMATYYAPGGRSVVLASGENFPDAIAGAALAGHWQVPLLLTRQDRLDSATTAQLRRLRPTNITVLGGGSAVSTDVARAAASYSTSKGWERLWGDSRYDTSEQVAAKFPRDRASGFVASGEDFPDALVGAALAGRLGTPLVLSQPNRISNPTGRALTRVNARSLDVIGGTGAITESNRRDLGDYLR